MVEKRLVECQECGYRWESTAESPRCAKAECGRSRKVEPVHDREEIEDDEDARPEPSTEIEDEPEPDQDEPDEDEPDEDEGYTPAFSTESVRKDTEQEEPPEPEIEDDTEGLDFSSDDRREPIEDPRSGDREDDQDEEQADEDAEAIDAEPRPTELELDPETLEPAIATTFQIAAHRRGHHWELEDDEAGLLADSWTPVLNHYAPAMMREHTVVGVALLATYSVVGPKLAEDRKQREIEEAEAEDDEPTDSIREPVIEPEPEIEDETSSESNADQAVGGYANV